MNIDVVLIIKAIRRQRLTSVSTLSQSVMIIRGQTCEFLRKLVKIFGLFRLDSDLFFLIVIGLILTDVDGIVSISTRQTS